MEFKETDLKEVVLIKPDIFSDERGFFMETYHQKKYAEAGIPEFFVQDNFSNSKTRTLRGLHYQLGKPQGKLVFVLSGEVFDVVVDIRKGSSQFGKWIGVHLSGENKLQLYIPPGFAHGFCTLSDQANFVYKCTDLYSPKDERGIIWNDPTIGIQWPIISPLLSPKDASFKGLKEMEDDLPLFEGY
ncbi:MAG TPA: dTDP-4-dehydrorhamnose 3,5-epimerase [Nitrospiria bacterium]|jgi:dTDP-4-dehydrorhamnose 3,5-epimerase